MFRKKYIQVSPGMMEKIPLIEAGNMLRTTAVRSTALHPCVTGDIDIAAS